MNENRVAKLQRELKKHRLDGVALLPGPNLLYFSGMHTHASERPLVLLIPAEGEAAVIIPTLEAPKARAAGIAEERIFHWGDGEGYMGAFQAASQVMGLAGKTIGAEKLYMRLLEWDMLEEFSAGLKREYADPILYDLRLSKDEGELATMRRAVAIAEEAMEKTLPQIKIGMTEKAIAAILTAELIGAGCEQIPFGPIVSSGDNATSPHAVPTDRPIGAGELLIIDWGAIVDDYPSDITRTFAVGAITAEQQAIYDAVRQANAAGVGLVSPQRSCHDIDVATRGVITKAGFGEYFIHRTGHGLGLEVHEEPSIMTNIRQQLRLGMVFTVEPGIYLPGVGGVRIEDDVVVTAEGCEVLTSMTRELVTIG